MALLKVVLLLAAIAGTYAEVIDRTIYFKNPHIMGPHYWEQKGGLTVDSQHYDAGVAFRVWAPNADANTAWILPAGSSTWAKQQMTKNSTDGNFYVNVGGASPGNGYTFQFTYQGGAPFTRLDPRAEGISPTVNQNSWAYSIVQDQSFDWGGVPYITPTPSKMVVYELHIPTFNVVSGAQGTFSSAIQKLSWLQSIGVTAVEIMPSATFSGPSNGWGYNPCAYYAIMNDFGGPNGLKSFVKAANQLGIAVLLDIVFNHADGGSSILLKYDGYAGPYGTGIYFFQSSQSLAFTPWGPRPNYASSPVAQYFYDNVQMWVTNYHISGFRWDSTICIRHGGTPNVPCYDDTMDIDSGWVLMQNGNIITKASPNFGWSTAEDTQEFTSITLAVSDQQAGLPGAPGGAEFTTQWDEEYYYTLEPAITLANNIQINLGQISSMLLDTDGEDPHRLMYTENHDKASNQQYGRIPAIVNPGGNAYSPTYWANKKAFMGMTNYFTSMGTPMLFYGQEFLTYASFNYPVPPPLDWGLATANVGATNFVKDFTSLRLNKGGVSSGLSGNYTSIMMQVATSSDQVLVYRRATNPGVDDVVIAANWYNTQYNSFTIYNFPNDGTWYIRMNSDSTRYSPLFANFGTSQTSITVSNGQGTIMLPEYAVVILSR
jgi:1,4-alpha-glucan branching enzyme